MRIKDIPFDHFQPRQRLVWSDVETIRRLAAEGKTIKEIHAQFPVVTPHHLRAIIANEYWQRPDNDELRRAHITQPYEYQAEYVRVAQDAPGGLASYRRRGRQCRFTARIPWSTVLAVRAEYQSLKLTMSELSLRHQVSPAWCWKVVHNRIRRFA